MKSFRNYIGKKIRINNETVKIKKLVEVKNNFSDVSNPSFWSFQAIYETDDGRKAILIYSPFGYLMIGENGQISRKKWKIEE